MDSKHIATEHPRFQEIRKHYKFADLLAGGTLKMREAHQVTLPQMPREDDDAYVRRVAMAVLFNAFMKTVDTYGLKPFAEKSKILVDGQKNNDLPQGWEWLENDINGKGMTIDTFLRKRVDDIDMYGKSIVIVNMPSLIDGDGKKISVADERKDNIHPYFEPIHPDSLIYWVQDRKGFKEIKLKYSAEEELEPGLIETVDYIDYWKRDEIITYKKSDKKSDEWIEVKKIKNEIGVIPIDIVNEVDSMPVLEDLIYLNMSHFIKSSDIDHIVQVACVPILHLAGFDEKEVSGTISVNNAYVSENPNSKAGWIELSGTGIEQATNSLERLEDKMSVYGIELTTPKNITRTATEIDTDADADVSILQAVVKSVENGFSGPIDIAAKWKNQAPPAITVDIFKDFNTTRDAYKKAGQLLDMRKANEISRETYLNCIDRLKIMGDDFDVEKELSLIGDGGDL